MRSAARGARRPAAKRRPARAGADGPAQGRKPPRPLGPLVKSEKRVRNIEINKKVNHFSLLERKKTKSARVQIDQ